MDTLDQGQVFYTREMLGEVLTLPVFAIGTVAATLPILEVSGE